MNQKLFTEEKNNKNCFINAKISLSFIEVFFFQFEFLIRLM